jgi:hypothetical protein
LSRSGCLFLANGALILAPVVLLLAMSGSDYVDNAVTGTCFGAIGVVYLICRRGLNSMSNARTLRHAQSDTAQRK